MKKILILNWRDPKHPNAGGAEQATLVHAQAWKEAGYDVTWFSSKVEDLPERETYKVIKIIRKGYYVFGVQFAAFRHLQNNKYDLIVDQIHGLPFFTPLYAKKTPILAYIHEVAKEVVWHNPYPFPLNMAIGLVARILEPLIFVLVYRNIQFMTVSDSTKKELLGYGVKDIAVIENGVSIPKNTKKYKKEKKKTLLYLGALAKDKGIEDAIEVFNRLAKRHKDWQFWVVGKADQEYEKYLKQKSSTKIKFWGFVSEKKKFELLSKAHVLVNPSIREGWGLVNIEANSMGTPVVGYNVAGMVDSVKNNETGILVQKNNLQALIKESEALLNEPQYKHMVGNTIEWSNKFNWKSSVSRSTQLIKTLL